MRQLISSVIVLSLIAPAPLKSDDEGPSPETVIIGCGLIAIVLIGGILLIKADQNNKDKVMKSWMGHTYDELLASWGPPSEIYKSGSGYVIVYTTSVSWTTPGSSTTQMTGSAYSYGGWTSLSGQATTTYTPATTHQWTSYRMFWVNSKGKIWKWARKGYW